MILRGKVTRWYQLRAELRSVGDSLASRSLEKTCLGGSVWGCGDLYSLKRSSLKLWRLIKLIHIDTGNKTIKVFLWKTGSPFNAKVARTAATKHHPHRMPWWHCSKLPRFDQAMQGINLGEIWPDTRGTVFLVSLYLIECWLHMSF